jgi:hypothetical protein
MVYMEITNNDPEQICGAKTKSGAPCTNPPEKGRKRCRLHGGAVGSGGTIGNKNAWKHGLYSASAVEERRTLNSYLKEMQDMVKQISTL